MSTEQNYSGQTEKYKNFTNLDVQSNHDIGDYRSNNWKFVRKLTVVTIATTVSHKLIYTFI